MRQLLAEGSLSEGTLVWTSEFGSEWRQASGTQLVSVTSFENSSPQTTSSPPLSQITSREANPWVWLAGFLAIPLAIGLLGYLGTGHASSSPLECRLAGAAIACNVVANDVSITDVSFNRGNCESPVPTQQDEDDVTAYEASPDGRANLKAMELAALMAMQGNNPCLVSPEAPSCKVLPAFIRVNANPIGHYSFGDKIQIPTVFCPNLLEYSVTANGQSWRWRANE